MNRGTTLFLKMALILIGIPILAKLLSYIDKNHAFSELSVKALNNIKYCAITISTIYLLGMPLYDLMRQSVDPPSFKPMATVIIFASLVIAVFAAVLQRLLKEVIRIKSENELTV